ncbi:MAG: glycosyltransferase family 39 protein [Bacteroidales bacterium]|nr:glycosyltransferase family 39 protein [Bacteroidales bacterium]
MTELIDKYESTATLYQAVNLPNGNWVIKYTMGPAILYAPFFFLGHLLAAPLGYPADGLSLPYQYIVAAGGLIYAVIGLLYLRKVLLRFFHETIAALLIILIVLGTNYFQLITFDGTLLSHNFLFTLYAILIWYTIRWHKQPQIKYAAIIGIVCGLIILIRPLEVICILIPVLWNFKDKESLKKKLSLMNRHLVHVVLVILLIFIVGIPQLIYWKLITGQYLFYSYTNPGEGFNFLAPYTLNFLFSFRKGWFIYTPVMAFSMIGFYYLYKTNKHIFYTILIFFLVSLWAISSWSCWWYAGGSFSSRSLVPAYTLLAIPMGYFINHLTKKRNVSVILVGGAGLFFVFLNLFQTWQFEHGILSKERMTRQYYFTIFGKTSVTENDKKLLLVERSTGAIEFLENEKDYKHSRICYYSFDDDDTTNLISRSGKGSFILNNAVPFSPGLDIKFNELTQNDHAWIRATVYIYIPHSHQGELPSLVVTFHHKNKTYKYRAVKLNRVNLSYGSWNKITMDYLTPEVRAKDDNMKVYVWYKGKENIYIDDFVVEVFD